MEKPQNQISNPRMTRRGFGLGASAATLGYIVHSGSSYHQEESSIAEPDDEEFVGAEEDFEAYNELSDSGYFNEDVRRFSEQLSLEVDV
jgi:hypothetical protein